MNDRVEINSHLNIPLSELRFHFSRSGGKGGQNVNKVETKVELLFDVRSSPALDEHQRYRLLSQLGSRLDGEGVLHIVAQESRSQWSNREAAVAKFADILRRALRPAKKRVATKIPHSSKQRRLDQKKKRGQLKRTRSSREE